MGNEFDRKTSPRHRIVVGLCTFERHEPLKEAIDSLVRIGLPEDVAVEFVLVDNDANGSAKYIFDAYLPDMPFGAHYFVEKNRGLANVRNRVVEEALKLGATAIAMFDDDEIVSQEWLIELWKTLRGDNLDGVSGPVYRLLQAGTSDFIKKFWAGGESGQRAECMMGTNNCLFSTKLVAADGMRIRFNGTFNFSGREDVVFSFDALRNGAKLGFAPKAAVIEKFSAQRSTFKYLLGRWFDAGLSDVMIARHFGFPILWRTVIEFLSIPFGAAVAPIMAICGSKKWRRIMLNLVKALGWIGGIFGKSTAYYAKRRD